MSHECLALQWKLETIESFLWEERGEGDAAAAATTTAVMLITLYSIIHYQKMEPQREWVDQVHAVQHPVLLSSPHQK